MAEEAVKVAVRVRPFNQREKDANAELIVDMMGNQTFIKKPKSNEEPKKYAYDFSYWSHDGFKTESDGYNSPDSPKYADQKKVYSDLGVGVMKNAWEGFNASLFAYGQTGSGKSYSVVGYGANKGIVPMFCAEIFTKIQTDKQEGTTYEVTFSMLEIYSEAVRDLLVKGANQKQGLAVREDPKVGFYPVGLKKQLVSSYDDIAKLSDEGTANRTIGATNMNATSSRAHTIITINLVQKYKNAGGKEMAKSSLVNLVDLAGSERAESTGATGDRLKEGAAINLSLTSLGNVIAALAENSGGKNIRVPYRDSTLTKLLMNALGGNSKTIMVAAISPADINFDESVSTLRYADRAKQIKCKAVVNEDPTEKLIKSLQEENASLKKLLAGGKIDPSLAGGNDESMKRALEENEKQMKQMQQTYEEKLAEAKATVNNLSSTKIQELAKTNPHFYNVNMDPALSGKNIIVLDSSGKKILGKPGKSDIPLYGLGISDPHGTVTVETGKVTLESTNQSRIMYNGKQLSIATMLNHLDRLLFGSSQYFVFYDPSKKTDNEVIPTFEMIQDEIAREAGLLSFDHNMTQEELQCQGELVDIMPAIEDANAISISLDKKVKFAAIVVSSDLKGDYNGKTRPMVIYKNFASGYQWIWSKERFLDRKEEISQFYNDIRDNGAVDNNKFKKFDPFVEPLDSASQIGTATIYPKAFGYNVADKGDHKITSLKGKPAGSVYVEILPCDKSGAILPDKSSFVKNPQKDSINKPISFLVNVKGVSGIDPVFDDIYCQFGIFDDANLTKTGLIKNSGQMDFKFSKQFNMVVTSEFLDNLLNKCLYVQIWGARSKTVVNKPASNMSTKEFFDKEKSTVDLRMMEAKYKALESSLTSVNKLVQVAKSSQKSIIPPQLLEAIIQSKPENVDKMLQKYAQYPEPPGADKSYACNLQ